MEGAVDGGIGVTYLLTLSSEIMDAVDLFAPTYATPGT